MSSSDDALGNLERNIGFKLPSEYRDYLSSVNGGAVEVAGYEIPVTFCSVSSLPGLIDDYRSSVGADTPLDADTGDKHEVVPIADDHHGNYVVLVVSGDAAGQLMFFDHEMYELVYVADSLKKFFDNPAL